MHDSFMEGESVRMPSESLESLLAPPSPAPPPSAVFERTRSELRKQRRLRRLRGAAILLGCYAAGLFTMMFCVPPTPVPQDPVSAPRQVRPPSEPVSNPSAIELEWRAVEWEAVAGVYREAGDAYLRETDPGNAARCYGHALNSGGPDALAVDVADSWLLIAIKHARKHESERER